MCLHVWESIRTIANDGRTEFLPVLQDFVPYRGRCPATIEVTIKKTIKETVEQGKGTGDHLMPLGDWFTMPCLDVTLNCLELEKVIY